MNDEKTLAPPREAIRLGRGAGKNARRFLCFLICTGILAAAFGVSGVWMNRNPINGPDDTVSEQHSIEAPPHSTPDEEAPSPIKQPIPNGCIGVVSMDLSSSVELLRNETVFRVDPQELLLRTDKVAVEWGGPTVLILHTHTAEAYVAAGEAWLSEKLENSVYSWEQERSIVTVGTRLCEVMNQNGIRAVQCTEDHGSNGGLQGSYRHAAACISDYLKKYPSIRYVIDLHRDGVLTRDGAPVRAVVTQGEKSYAQVLAVVGSEGNGTACPNREANLALALQLCNRLNSRIPQLCRPTLLRNASYNQELSPRSLLLEIGSVGNDQEEAMRTAELVGEILSELIRERAA